MSLRFLRRSSASAAAAAAAATAVSNRRAGVLRRRFPEQTPTQRRVALDAEPVLEAVSELALRGDGTEQKVSPR